MRLCLPLLAAACLDAEPSALPAEALAPPAALQVSTPVQLLRGQPNTFLVYGNLGQQEPVYLAASVVGQGNGPCPPALGGTCLSIRAPRVVGNAPFDGDVAEITVTIPPTLALGTVVHFQSAVIRGVGGRASQVSAPVSGVVVDYVTGCTVPQAINYDPGATVDDGSCDVNPPGTVLVAGSAWADLSPPDGWSQCSGFLNTAADDVAAEVMDNCLNTGRLRLRVWDETLTLTDDVYSEDVTPWAAWPDFNYLGPTAVTAVQTTWWNPGTAFFTEQGGDSCWFSGVNLGVSLGSGFSLSLNISPADLDPAREIRLNCDGDGFDGYRVALYR